MRRSAVNLSAGELTPEALRALSLWRVKKGGELLVITTSGGCAPVVSGQRGDHLQFILYLIGKDFPSRTPRQLTRVGLEIAVRLISNQFLAPERAPGFAFYLELHFGQTFRCIARHQIVCDCDTVFEARGVSWYSAEGRWRQAR